MAPTATGPIMRASYEAFHAFVRLGMWTLDVSVESKSEGDLDSEDLALLRWAEQRLAAVVRSGTDEVAGARNDIFTGLRARYPSKRFQFKLRHNGRGAEVRHA